MQQKVGTHKNGSRRVGPGASDERRAPREKKSELTGPERETESSRAEPKKVQDASRWEPYEWLEVDARPVGGRRAYLSRLGVDPFPR